MILNSKRINTFIPSASFRMETLSTILPLLRPNDLAVSLDLRDPNSRDLLGFSVNGKTYRYRALPFGLKPAPRVFTRLVSEVAAYLRGLCLFCYLDDWLLVANSEHLLAAQVLILVQTVQALGFIINWDKSELSPTHTPIFLGAEIDMRNQLARPSPDRIQKIRLAAATLRRTRRTSARKFLQFVGYLASLVDVLPDCRLFMRPFQHHLLRHYRPSRDPLSSQTPIPGGITLLLARWTDFSFLSQGKPLRVPQPSVTVTTDASLQGWGGGALSGQHGSREVVSQSCYKTHQCPGVSSSAAFITAVPPPIKGTHCTDTRRQCYGSCIHKQTGRYPLNEPQQFSGSVLEMVSPQGHHAGHLLSPRTGQPDCRFPFPGTLFTLRVDAPPRGHVPHPEDDGPSSSGLICLGPQPPAPSLLLPGTGPRSMGPGCLLYQLEGNPSLCLSSDSPNSSRPTENQGGQSSGTPGGPLLAQETMVPGTIRSPCKSSDESPPATRYSGSPDLGNPTSTSSLTSSNGLAAIGESARQSGLSDRAAEFVMQSRRDSTREIYNSRLAAFSEWCESRGVETRTAPLGCVADFLISLFDKKRALSTIRGYRSAIAAIHSGFPDGSGISSSPYLTKLLRSFFLKRPPPPMTKLVPAWSLPRVLDALARPPFEPMATSSLHHLSMKTTFLLAIASGQRRSALHALCLTPGHIRWERCGVRLIPRATYIAKNQTASSGPVEIFISPLSELSSIAEDKVWCLVKALKWYLDRTKSLRKDDQLFIITREPYTAASRDSISRWIVEAIQASGTEALLPGANPRAHDTRGISTSWALFQGVPLAEIQKAAYWHSSNSFISHYLRDIPAGEESFASAVLTAAGSVA
ncbi:uncharacterized protein [Diadema setosum]|uniref:uncharacterized protein n=1 Tax=Diadema setosum TaxID=31175 RepID=UPI003B3A2907